MKKILIVLILVLSCNQSKDEANIFFLKGNVAFKDKNFSEAIKYYNEAIKKQNDFADAYNNIGLSYQKIGDNKNAEINFKNAIENDENFIDAKLNYASILMNSNNQEALIILNSIEKILIDSANYCNIRGQAEFLNNDFTKSSFYLQKAVLTQPKNSEFLTNLGTLQYYQKNYNDAEKNFLKSKQIDSTNSMTINNLGLIYSKNKKQKANEYFKKALNIDPKNQIILNNFAYFLIKNNEINQSEDFIKQSENIDSQNPYLIRNKGILALEKNSNNSIELLELAFQKNANIENIYSELGSAYFKFNKKPKACEYWQKGKLLNETEASLEYKLNCL